MKRTKSHVTYIGEIRGEVLGAHECGGAEEQPRSRGGGVAQENTPLSAVECASARWPRLAVVLPRIRSQLLTRTAL